MNKFIASCKKCNSKQGVDTDEARYCGRCIMKPGHAAKGKEHHKLIIIANPKFNSIEQLEKFIDSKECIDCNEIKSLDEFHKNSASKDGRIKRCKVCYKIWDSPEERAKRKI